MIFTGLLEMGFTTEDSDKLLSKKPTRIEVRPSGKRPLAVEVSERELAE